MGIGLTMVKRMVEDYNGTITVVSTIDKGAIFTISMPSNL
jgi:signal transduction histidine kinase